MNQVHFSFPKDTCQIPFFCKHNIYIYIRRDGSSWGGNKKRWYIVCIWWFEELKTVTDLLTYNHNNMHHIESTKPKKNIPKFNSNQSLSSWLSIFFNGAFLPLWILIYLTFELLEIWGWCTWFPSFELIILYFSGNI